MRYRKKPIIVEAHQHDGDSIKETWPQWLKEAYGRGDIYEDGINIDELLLKIENQPYGRIRVFRGDWIIQGIKGELYPCKEDIFRESYELFCTDNPHPGDPVEWSDPHMPNMLDQDD